MRESRGRGLSSKLERMRLDMNSIGVDNISTSNTASVILHPYGAAPLNTKRDSLPVGGLMRRRAMIDLPSSALGPRTPTQWAPDSTTSKIRDSCQSCASSKIKCPKEKPTCSRCARRGIPCEYLATKRPGRKRDTINVVRPDMSTVESVWPSIADLSPTSSRPGSVSGAEGSSTSDMFSGLLMPLEPSLASTLAGVSNEFDGFYDSPLDLFTLDALDPINFAQARNDIEKLLIPDDIGPDPVTDTSSLDRLPPSKASSPSSNGQSLSTSYTSITGLVDSSCSCLMRTLQFVKTFFSTQPPACAVSNQADDATATSNSAYSSHPLAQAVVIENKQTIEAISNMLQCSCAEDAHMLTMLAMIVFKMLGRYAAAAREQPGEAIKGRDRPTRNVSAKEQIRQLSSHCLENEDLRRRTAQSILSELHHVQRLVNQLSPRLKTHGVGAASGGRVSGVRDARGDCKMSSVLDGETTTATFSATTMDQIEIDLRRCLSTLSSEIISMLRQS
jgi:hypothetical protein